MRQETTGVSAGIAVLFVGLLASAICVTGIGLGIVGIRKGEPGRPIAWTGISIGSLPFVVLIVWGLIILLEALRP